MKLGENFFHDVFEVVKLIPKGRVTSYGAIAKYLGMKSGARMVGWALNNIHETEQIPAHRVVNSIGLLSGRHHFNPPELMQQLLEQEGVKVKDHQVQDFQNYLWDPMKKLI